MTYELDSLLKYFFTAIKNCLLPLFRIPSGKDLKVP